MRLHILVSHHREPEWMVGRFMLSLAAQEGVDWSEVGVSMLTDGEENALNPAFVSSFGVRADYSAVPHGGVCATRNRLMDSSDADYLMFCDVDDSFHSTLGLRKLLAAIDDLGCDVIASPYDSEAGGRIVRHSSDVARVHGKAFRREFLVANGIRFPGEMPFSGDMSFVWLAFALAERSAWLMDSFYLWRENPESVTRRDPHHRLRTYHMVLRDYELLYEDLGERGRRDLQDALMGSVFAMMCLDDTSDAYMDGPEDAVAEARGAIRDFVARYADRYAEVPDEVARETLDEALGMRHARGDRGMVGRWLVSVL